MKKNKKVIDCYSKKIIDSGCPYCGSRIKLVKGETVSKNKNGILLYICGNWPKCDAYVHVQSGTILPLGPLADAKLRKLRRDAHAVFDLLWMNNRMDKKAAYGWLADRLGIEKSMCHIGRFLEGNCLRTIRECQSFVIEFNIPAA